MFSLSTVTAEVGEKKGGMVFNKLGFKGFCVRKCGFGISQESALQEIEADIIDYLIIEVGVNISKDLNFEHEDINIYSSSDELELSGQSIRLW